MCSGESSYEIVGVVGVLLVLFGVVQAGAGLYFMLTLPIFEIASNIWTGATTGLTGIILTYIGCSNEARRRSYVVLTMCLATLFVNVANVVVIQVGENSSFLSEEKKLSMKSDRNQIPFQIAIWLTTAVTSLVIFCSYVVAQVLFCSRIQRTNYKGQMSIKEGLSYNGMHQQQSKGTLSNRFFPPSRVVSAKVECSQPDELCIYGQGPSSNALHDIDGNGRGDGDIEEGIRLGMLTPGDNVSLDTVTTCVDNESNAVDLNHVGAIGYEVDETMISRSNFNRAHISQQRFSTFKPKGMTIRTSLNPNKIIYEGILDKTSVTTNHKTTKPEIIMSVENLENIPAFLQNHPQSWTFLVPNASNEGTEMSKNPEPSLNEVNINFSYDSKNESEHVPDTSKERYNTRKRCSSFLPVSHSSKENLVKETPRSTPKLKRPKDKPPLPPGKIQAEN